MAFINIQGLVITSHNISAIDITEGLVSWNNKIKNNQDIKNVALEVFNFIKNLGPQDENAIMSCENFEIKFHDFDVNWTGDIVEGLQNFQPEFHRLKKLLPFI